VQKIKILNNLVDLAHENTSEGRRELLRGVTDLFLEAPQGLNPTELDLFGSVIGDLVHDMEMEVRASLAEQLSLSPEAPANVITMLANDNMEVTRSVLQNSPVLSSEILLKIIKQRSQEHKLAVAIRNEIDPEVSDAFGA
jgi:uncharacterized protein (DUF2336 family)